MVQSLKELKDKRQQILFLATKHGASSIKIFGSVAREEADQQSDIDFLVKLENGRSLFDIIGLKLDLENLLGRRVDVVTDESLHWMIRDQVLSEAIPL